MFPFNQVVKIISTATISLTTVMICWSCAFIVNDRPWVCIIQHVFCLIVWNYFQNFILGTSKCFLDHYFMGCHHNVAICDMSSYLHVSFPKNILMNHGYFSKRNTSTYCLGVKGVSFFYWRSLKFQLLRVIAPIAAYRRKSTKIKDYSLPNCVRNIFLKLISAFYMQSGFFVLLKKLWRLNFQIMLK